MSRKKKYYFNNQTKTLVTYSSTYSELHEQKTPTNKTQLRNRIHTTDDVARSNNHIQSQHSQNATALSITTFIYGWINTFHNIIALSPLFYTSFENFSFICWMKRNCLDMMRQYPVHDSQYNI